MKMPHLLPEVGEIRVPDTARVTTTAVTTVYMFTIVASGFYAGFLSSGFMIGRGLSSHFWGLVADRCGGRFVLICGLMTTAILSIALGVSTTFAYAFVFR